MIQFFLIIRGYNIFNKFKYYSGKCKVFLVGKCSIRKESKDDKGRPGSC